MLIVEGKILGFKRFTAKNGVEWVIINASFPFKFVGDAHTEGEDCKSFWVRSSDLLVKLVIGGKVRVGVRYGGADLIQQ